MTRTRNNNVKEKDKDKNIWQGQTSIVKRLTKKKGKKKKIYERKKQTHAISKKKKRRNRRRIKTRKKLNTYPCLFLLFRALLTYQICLLLLLLPQQTSIAARCRRMGGVIRRKIALTAVGKQTTDTTRINPSIFLFSHLDDDALSLLCTAPLPLSWDAPPHRLYKTKNKKIDGQQPITSQAPPTRDATEILKPAVWQQKKKRNKFHKKKRNRKRKKKMSTHPKPGLF